MLYLLILASGYRFVRFVKIKVASKRTHLHFVYLTICLRVLLPECIYETLFDFFFCSTICLLLCFIVRIFCRQIRDYEYYWSFFNRLSLRFIAFRLNLRIIAREDVDPLWLILFFNYKAFNIIMFFMFFKYKASNSI